MGAWSSTEEPAQYEVHLGAWTNWSRGPILGKTLTITRRDGDLLIAFTAFFIAFVGSRFWRIACLCAHRLHSSEKPENAIYHQRQIILRNTASADSGLVQLLQLIWAWRHSIPLLQSILPAFFMAIFCVVAFTIAGGFSSQIASSVGTEVLLNGTDCGYISKRTISQFTESTVAYGERMGKNALNYVQQCYYNSNSLTDCSNFVTKRIPITVDESALCPFNANICRSQSENILLDTGHINSHHHLGINAPPNERILFRRTLQCAPLKTSGFKRPNKSGSRHNSTLYNYGPQQDPFNLNINYTYKVKDVESQYNREIGDEVAGTYLVVAFPVQVENGVPITTPIDASGFNPNDDISLPDADLHLIFLSGNGVIFSQPTEDPWYRATHHLGRLSGFGSNGTQIIQDIYRPEEAASPLCCAERFQYCFANVTACGPLASFADAASGALELTGTDGHGIWDDNGDPTDKANANPDVSRLAWFISILQSSQIWMSGIINELGPESLVSTQTLQAGYQLHLPSNQWKIDIKHAWAISQAYLQALFVETAGGLSDKALAAYTARPLNLAQQQMCQNQKIRSTGYASFSLFALILTYTLGLAIIVVSFSLEPFLDCLHRKWNCQTYAQLEWTTNSTLQLHRLGHDSTYDKTLTWSHCVDTIPTTNPVVRLARLDVRDIRHPMLKPQKSLEALGTTRSSCTLEEVHQHHRPSGASSEQINSTVLQVLQQDLNLPQPGSSTHYGQHPMHASIITGDTITSLRYSTVSSEATEQADDVSTSGVSVVGLANPNQPATPVQRIGTPIPSRLIDGRYI
ncbi:hypothetical protein F5Y10DRAFT_291899 [Nemania abortiva]|nr:hypothetical protein F5Y10DRAFT_291899 [Nemania abortiva]